MSNESNEENQESKMDIGIELTGSQKSSLSSAIKSWERGRLNYLSGSKKLNEVAREILGPLLENKDFDSALRFIRNQMPEGPERVNLLESVLSMKIKLEES